MAVEDDNDLLRYPKQGVAFKPTPGWEVHPERPLLMLPGEKMQLRVDVASREATSRVRSVAEELVEQAISEEEATLVEEKGPSGRFASWWWGQLDLPGRRRFHLIRQVDGGLLLVTLDGPSEQMTQDRVAELAHLGETVRFLPADQREDRVHIKRRWVEYTFPMGWRDGGEGGYASPSGLALYAMSHRAGPDGLFRDGEGPLAFVEGVSKSHEDAQATATVEDPPTTRKWNQVIGGAEARRAARRVEAVDGTVSWMLQTTWAMAHGGYAIMGNIPGCHPDARADLLVYENLCRSVKFGEGRRNREPTDELPRPLEAIVRTTAPPPVESAGPEEAAGRLPSDRQLRKVLRQVDHYSSGRGGSASAASGKQRRRRKDAAAPGAPAVATGKPEEPDAPPTPEERDAEGGRIQRRLERFMRLPPQR